MKKYRITGLDVFLFIFALMLTAISFQKTRLGLEQLFGVAAMPLAFIISALLLFIDYFLRNAKLEGESVYGLMIIYFIAAIICFIPNFNSLYVQFIKADVYIKELHTINAGFNLLKAEVTDKISCRYKPAVKMRIKILKEQLREEINDPVKPGVGRKALLTISEIEGLLGKKINILQLPQGKPKKDDYNEAADSIEKQIDSIIMLFDAVPEEELLKKNVIEAVSEYDNKINKLLLGDKHEISGQAETFIKDALNRYNKLGGEIESVLKPARFKFTPIRSEIDEIGKIGYSFKHASKNFGIYPFIVFLISFILNFIIPIFIIVIIKQEEDSLYVLPRFDKNGRVVLNKA